MDLSYGTEYEVFRGEMRTFLEENRDKAPVAGEVNREKSRAWQRLLIDHGYAGRTIPKEYGGYGADPDILEARIIAEEFARSQVRGPMGGQGIAYLIPVLLDVGTEDQRKEIIPPTISGEMIWCEGYSEPNAGSDLASLSTRAVLDGDEWVVNGQKIWTSTAKIADWIFCLVRSEPDLPKHQGISFLLFSMDSPGIDVRPIRQMNRQSEFNEVFFTDVRVPKDQIVGNRGDGWMVANNLLAHERGDLGDPNLTLTRFNLLMELMQEETIDGQRIVDNPVFRDRLMEMQGRVMALRYNDLRILSSKLNKQRIPLANALVKMQGTELRHALEALAVDALGEHGTLFEDSPYLRDNGLWQYFYMTYLGLIIGGGTNQIQKNIISERVLGMPKEPKYN